MTEKPEYDGAATVTIDSLPLSECDSNSNSNSNSNSGSLFGRRFPDDLSSPTTGSKENSPSLFSDDPSQSPPSSLSRLTALQIRRRQLIATLAKNQPKIIRRTMIDLATDEEKKNPDDEWFKKRFHIDPNAPRTLPTNLADVKECLKEHKISPVTARMAVQLGLEQKLAEKRRREQEKRKAVYDADNENVEDDATSEPDANKEENEDADSASDDEPEENDITLKDDDEKPKNPFIDYEADESDAEDDDEVNGDDDDDKVGDENAEGTVTTESDCTELNDEKKGGVTKNDAAEVIDETTPENTDSDVPYWWKDWQEIGMPTYTQLMQEKREERERITQMTYGEFDPSMALNEAVDLCTFLDPNESGRSSPASELLDYIAVCCSGTFEYSEDNQPRYYRRSANRALKNAVVDGVSDNDDTGVVDRNDDSDEDEPVITPHKKGRKRRLVFSDDEDSDDINVQEEEQNPEINESENAAGSSPSEQTDLIVTGDKILDENEFDDDDNGNRPLFTNDYGDDDEIQPNAGVSDDENRENEENEEINSSDDELEVFHRLQNAQKPKKSEYIEEEASLSGEDVGSGDENDDDDQLNVYEAEEGDNDELPDEETIKEQLHKQWMKQQQDEEDRKLLYWKDQLLMDGDLTAETDRTFRFKLREVSNEKNADDNADNTADDADDDEVDDEQLRKRRKEMLKWKTEATKADESEAKNAAPIKTNALLNAALKFVEKKNSDTSSQSLSSAERNSLLGHRKTLSQVVGQADITLYTTPMIPGTSRTNDGCNVAQKVTKHPTQAVTATGTVKKKMRHSVFSSML